MIRLDPWFCWGLAWLLLVLPLPWVAELAAAAGFHELCHYLAIGALGGQVRQIRLGLFGAVMDTVLPEDREWLAAAAGPAGSFLLVLLFRRHWPRLALWGLTQGTFNLLPLYPLDGGRILRCLLRPWLAPAYIQAVEAGIGVVLALVFLWWDRTLGLILLFRWVLGKIPCNGFEKRVQ